MSKRLALLSTAAALVLAACQPANQTDAADAKKSESELAPAIAAASADLSRETDAYKAWVSDEIDQLVTGTQAFADALKSGNLDEAKRLYPLVRMHYERSEPIAESFGDLDPRIDNREADLEAGEAWTGFHTIEKILWTQNTTQGTEALADQLVNDVKELRAKIPTAEVTGDLMVQGSVDLLNEVSTSKITGEEEIFSKTDLYDFKANIEGAEKIFEILKDKINAKDPTLVKALQERFAAVNELLAKHQVGDQHYKSYTDLTEEDTKALAEAVNKLGEPLAQMGIVLE
ncbi:EfeM/EfeO family lipoprotein [Moraxella sp. FZLJ2107]|uniref:iron uptake system protein EfeO n=1 Tax=unclassified Moraxella TaxID=2685852 RepID=UPI0020C8FEBD|nr:MULTISPECIES: iron uptake system protein EfeO [unclassified Moraxella]UTO04375.1 EfeM/EfeO family lipoprotein [Moraxella sp. FZLJ2107]UTO23208.1 EfeM/EfeO family lipoprotein [Moraxella sp. FZLJ2109]